MAWDAIALPAGRRRRADAAYVALGDGFASGEEFGGYLPSTDIGSNTSNHANRCHLSGNDAYPKMVFDDLQAGLDIEFVPGVLRLQRQPGASSHMNGTATRWGEVPQLKQGWVDRNTTHISIQVGGEDARLLRVLRRCGQLDDCRDVALESGEETLRDQMPADIAAAADHVQAVVDEAVALAPNARVALVGYPKLLESWSLRYFGRWCDPPNISTGERSWFRSQVESFNDAPRTGGERPHET